MSEGIEPPTWNLGGRRLATLLTVGATVWAAAILAAPAFRGASLAGLAYEGGRLICHQRSERSFHLAGTPMPVCARCTGLYLSGAAGALAAWLRRRRRDDPAPRGARLIFVAAAVPMAVSVAGELSGLLPSSNVSRMASALPLGAAAGWIFVQSLRAEEPWKEQGVAL